MRIGLSHGNEDINVLIDLADKAMYYSKYHDKNQCNIYDKKVSKYYKNKKDAIEK